MTDTKQSKKNLAQRCRGCGSQDLYQDDEGNTMCYCGLVIRESNFESGATFTEKRRDGQKYDFSSENRDRTQMARQYISEIVKQLKIHEQCPQYIDLIGQTPIRIMQLAYKTYFIDQGSNIRIYSACALYIALRFHKAPFLLMDFSDQLKINLFKLAKCYRNLAKFLNATLKLNEKLPSIDPSVYIPRFCRICDFAEDNEAATKVCETALKLMKRMKLDWMTHGRRPSSLFGCSIIIAARMHGFKRTTSEISQIVYVCQETLRKRLEEFQDTQAAQLTLQKFHQIDDVEQISKEMDPPAFSKKLKKQMLQDDQKIKEIESFETPEQQLMNQDDEIQDLCENRNGEAERIEKEMDEIMQEYQKESQNKNEDMNVQEVVNFPLKSKSTQNNIKGLLSPTASPQGVKSNNNKNSAKDPLFQIDEQLNGTSPVGDQLSPEEFLQKLEKKEIENSSIKDPIGQINENEDLSDFSDDDKAYFNPQNFVALKSIMWHKHNESWIKEQTRQKDEQKNDKKQVRKRNQRRSDQLMNEENPVEAILKSQKGKKLDAIQLNEIFNEVQNTEINHIFTQDNSQALQNEVEYYKPITRNKIEDNNCAFGQFQKQNEDFVESDDD